MSKVILDNDLRAKLGNFDTEVALCNEQGQTVAHVLPVATFNKLVYAWANAQFSREEIEKARKEPGGMTTAEVLAYLEKLVHQARNGS